jgi:hypothetical protein
MRGLSDLNLAITKIALRAENQDAEVLRDTFVESGVGEQLHTIDHQILYGRRGTGKTHAATYLVSEVRKRGDVGLFIDLRTMGSPGALFEAPEDSTAERASRYLVDLLGSIRDGLERAVLDDESLFADELFVDKLDDLLQAITHVKLGGEVEIESEDEGKDLIRGHAGVKGEVSLKPSLGVEVGGESSREGRSLRREIRRGSERVGLNFRDVARALRELSRTLSSRRIWLVLDEWSSIPRDIQPYLAEFLLRCVMPLTSFSVKIMAIEQQATFRISRGTDEFVGFELGADISATLALDDFMVFEQNEEFAREFFKELFYKHLTETDAPAISQTLDDPDDLVRQGFTDIRAFDELVKASEGVPRDAINIARRAATHAREKRISVLNIREAAQYWYQTDKARAIESHDQANRLLRWLIEDVIRGKKARGFLVHESDSQDPLLLTLFGARILHIVRRGYSAQDLPGERFDVWVIDYGAYVDLIATVNAPKGLLPIEFTDVEVIDSDVEVPIQDFRAIRRAILDLDKFRGTGEWAPPF